MRHVAMSRLFRALRFGGLFAPKQVRRRRIAARVRAASEALVLVGDVVMPFKDVVAAGLIMRRVPQSRIHHEVEECIRQAIESADCCMPAVRMRNRTLIEEVTRRSMRWRDDPGGGAPARTIGFPRSPARDAGQSRRARKD